MMENIMIGLIALTMMTPQEGTNKVVTQTVGNTVNVGEVVEVYTGRVSVTGDVPQCWASPVYGSNGVKTVKVRCN